MGTWSSQRMIACGAIIRSRGQGGVRPASPDRGGFSIKNSKLFCLTSLTIFVLGVSSCKSPVQELTVSASHRIFSNYHEEFRIRMGEKFQLSDTDYYVKAVDFVPDFAIDTSTGKVVSRSKSLRNPAVKLIVYQGKKKVDEVWAFQKVAAPHFSRHSMLGFRLLDFKIEEKFRKAEDKPDKTD